MLGRGSAPNILQGVPPLNCMCPGGPAKNKFQPPPLLHASQKRGGNLEDISKGPRTHKIRKGNPSQMFWSTRIRRAPTQATYLIRLLPTGMPCSRGGDSWQNVCSPPAFNRSTTAGGRSPRTPTGGGNWGGPLESPKPPCTPPPTPYHPQWQPPAPPHPPPWQTSAPPNPQPPQGAAGGGGPRWALLRLAYRSPPYRCSQRTCRTWLRMA